MFGLTNMSNLSIIGAFIITFSLLAYGIGCISVIRFKLLSPWVLLFLTLGLLLDIVAVSFMITGSNNSPFNLHGLLGYSGILLMLINVIFIWKEYRVKGINSKLSKNIVRYTKYAYLWWLIVYFTGSLLVIWL